MAHDLDRQTALEIRLAIEDLNTDFNHYLDHGDIDKLLDLFTDDVYYTHGDRRSNGRHELEQVFRRRTAAGPRTSRHLSSGLKIEIESAERARGTSVCATFAADGLPPLSPAIPTLVADFEDLYVKCTDGRWRIKERHIRRIFVDPANTGPVGR